MKQTFDRANDPEYADVCTAKFHGRPASQADDDPALLPPCGGCTRDGPGNGATSARINPVDIDFPGKAHLYSYQQPSYRNTDMYRTSMVRRS